MMKVDCIVKAESVKRNESRKGKKRGGKKWKNAPDRVLRIFNI